MNKPLPEITSLEHCQTKKTHNKDNCAKATCNVVSQYQSDGKTGCNYSLGQRYFPLLISEICTYQRSAINSHQNTSFNDLEISEWCKGGKERTVKMEACATPFMVQRSPIVGRCLVASKELSQGELIVRERPLGKFIKFLSVIMWLVRRRT